MFWGYYCVILGGVWRVILEDFGVSLGGLGVILEVLGVTFRGFEAHF